MLRTVPASGELGKSQAEYRASTEAPEFLRSYLRVSERYEEWARLMGIELQQCGRIFAYGGIRSSLKARFLLYSNPFLLWLRNCEDLCGSKGDQALEVLERAIAVAPDAATRGVSEFVRIAIEFVRHVEDAHAAYAAGRPGEAANALAPARAGFDDLARIAQAANLRIGGSLADIERCRTAKEQVERVIRRIKDYGDGSLGYRPSFETLTHPKFVPHDQANWWLINDWANE
jgi:tetratricopeptide (TPR) repeat protein